MPVKRYEVPQPNGGTATMKLNDADAKRLGVYEEPAGAPAKKAAKKPANKARTAANKKG